MSSSIRQDEEPAVPFPPRYWWLKRIAAGCAILLVLLVVLHWGWSRLVHNRLQAEIDRLRAAGEPILPEDFDTPSVPAARNAAAVLEEAANAFVVPTEATKDISVLISSPQFTLAELADVALYVDANTNALSLLRQARNLPEVDWGIRIRSPVFASTSFLSSFSSYRSLAKFLAVAARYHHQNGNEAEAVAELRNLLALGEAVDHYPSLIGHLVAISIDALAVKGVESIAHDIAASAGGVQLGPDSASDERFEVKALIAELLDEQVAWEGFRRAFQCERMYVVDAVNVAATDPTKMFLVTTGSGAPNSPSGSLLGLLSRPIIELEGVELLRWGTAWVAAAKEPRWPALCDRLPPHPTTNAGLWERLRHPLTKILMPAWDRFALLHYRALAERRMAAIALALRRYELDHGHRPVQLADLVPEYLVAVPLDPFAADGRTIGYRPDADPPVLYSIGSDGVDDEGAYTFRPGGYVNPEALDLPFFLDGRPEPQPP